MPVMTSYAHGVPSPVDLATPNPKGPLVRRRLFRWNMTEEPTDRPGVSYTMAARRPRRRRHDAALRRDGGERHAPGVDHLRDC